MLSWMLVLICLATTAHAQYWTVTGNLTYARAVHTATQLPNGNVLVAAGTNDSSSFISLSSAELYNATTSAWIVTGSLVYARYSHTATLLPNRNVLIAAGANTGGYLTTAELYNATTGVWTVTGNLTYARSGHTATLLPNADILVAGGDSIGSTSEFYNTTTGIWTVTGSLTYARCVHTATLLPNGNVLVAGGCNGENCEIGSLNSAELYYPTTGVWTLTGNLTHGREFPRATLLPNGNVLIAGGCDGSDCGIGFLNSAEVYNSTVTPTPTPTLTSAPKPKPTLASTPMPTGSTSTAPTPVAGGSSPNTRAIAGGIVGGLVGLVLLLLLLWLFRSRYWNKKDVNDSDYTKPMIPMTRPKSERSVSQVSNARKSDDIYISFTSLKLGAVLGQGHFGQVYQADYTGAQVAVKKSKGIDEKLILEEATMMKNLPPHPNVLQYYGVSQENGEFMMVTELCDKGNLAQYLRNPKNNLTSQQCRQFCRQIASGMWHISKYGIVHRDLRAENILLSSTETKLVAKVADFGLSRSLQSLNEQTNDSAYYRMTELKPIPVAWTAPEVLNQSDQLKYFAASDVWSFGIVIWEIYSRGVRPFDGIDVNVVIGIIRNRTRTTSLLPRPDKCPDDIFAIMSSCWAFNPQDRPTFEQLCNQLS